MLMRAETLWSSPRLGLTIVRSTYLPTKNELLQSIAFQLRSFVPFIK